MILNDNPPPLKYARIEEERRFVLDSIPEELREKETFVRIQDHYIPGTRLRLRRIESESGDPLVYKFGQKFSTPELESHQTIMTNFYLNAAEYRTLKELGGLKITKRRYHYQKEGVDYSIDVYEGNLSGLIMAEVESCGEWQVSRLPIPSFAIREVTGDLQFTGGELAKLSQVEFQHRMEGW